MGLKSKFSFNPFYEKISSQIQSEIDNRPDYPSTYSPDMKKWGDTIIKVYEEMKNGKF